MAIYRYDKSVKLYRRSRPKTLLLTLSLVLVIGLVIFLLINRGNDSGVVGGREVRVTNDPYQTFVTDYFSFTVSKSWLEAKDLNSEGVSVYRKFKGTNPLGILTIKVNAGYPSLITALVPVSVLDGKVNKIGDVSEHCSKFLPSGLNLDPHDVVAYEVSFRCWTDSTAFLVSAGVSGGGLELPLLRPSGELSKYSISYQSTSFETDRNAILEVLKTFETR